MRDLLKFVPVMALAACGPVIGATGNGSAARSFTASGFDAVRLAGSDDVRVIRGPAASVSATGPQQVLDRLDIHTEGSTLVVARKPSWGWNWSGKGAVVTVTMPAIRGATITGSGGMTVDRVDGGDFDGAVTGSGDLAISAINASNVKLHIAGSGDIDAAGTSRSLALDISGSGDIRAEKLVADTASVSVQGSGGATAGARRSGSVSVAGSGEARIVGTTNCTVTKIGSGEARCG